MDCTGACFSPEGYSLTGFLNNTQFTPQMASFDGQSSLSISQKLDHLIQLTTTQAEELNRAKSLHESSKQEIVKLTEKVTNLEEQLTRDGTQQGTNYKLPRKISVSNFNTLYNLLLHLISQNMDITVKFNMIIKQCHIQNSVKAIHSASKEKQFDGQKP